MKLINAILLNLKIMVQTIQIKTIILFHYMALGNGIITKNLRNNDEYDFWEENTWLIVLLIIVMIVLIIIIVILIIKIFTSARKKNKNNKKKKSKIMDSQRASQKYNSDYNKNTKEIKKYKYKERMIEEEEQ
jgi:competence protein ComGC